MCGPQVWDCMAVHIVGQGGECHPLILTIPRVVVLRKSAPWGLVGFPPVPKTRDGITHLPDG
jgi:hypothetical protein